MLGFWVATYGGIVSGHARSVSFSVCALLSWFASTSAISYGVPRALQGNT